MENDIILKVLMWGLGICATGFFFLAFWIRQVSSQTVTNTMIYEELKEIKTALVGTMEKRGIITVMHQHGDEIEALKKVNNEKGMPASQRVA